MLWNSGNSAHTLAQRRAGSNDIHTAYICLHCLKTRKVRAIWDEYGTGCSKMRKTRGTGFWSLVLSQYLAVNCRCVRRRDRDNKPKISVKKVLGLLHGTIDVLVNQCDAYEIALRLYLLSADSAAQAGTNSSIECAAQPLCIIGLRWLLLLLEGQPLIAAALNSQV